MEIPPAGHPRRFPPRDRGGEKKTKPHSRVAPGLCPENGFVLWRPRNTNGDSKTEPVARIQILKPCALPDADAPSLGRVFGLSRGTH